MTQPEHGHAAPTYDPIPAADLAALHEDDRKAARNIIVLMVVIFLTGVCLYLVVDYFCAQNH